MAASFSLRCKCWPRKRFAAVCYTIGQRSIKTKLHAGENWPALRPTIAICFVDTPLDRWLYFLRHGEHLDAEAVPVALDVPEVRWALGDLFMISRTDPDRELYEAVE